MTPPAVEIANITRRFGETVALDAVSLSIQQGEFFSLLGPSGCGKTTLLRIIAGLEIPDSGCVRIGGADAGGMPAHQRPVNTVFQSYALFPHLDVWANIAFGLRMKKRPQSEIEERVDKVMALVEIEGLARRRPHQLSGGQKQRVALARAIVNEPKVLLLDEPLAALDLKLRKQLQLELRNLQHRLGITFIYVTHDQEEALVLSDRLAVLRLGKIEQLGPARELYEHPRTRFTSQFLGSCNLLEAKVRRRDEKGAVLDCSLGELYIPELPGSPKAREIFTLAIRPEKVRLLPKKPAGDLNVFPVQIEQIIYAGSESHYQLRARNELLRAEVMNTHEGSNTFVPGAEAWACLPPAALIVLED
ncbi:MAG TPA: ABC transporter ATP-binding protein [Verrucomicrobiae bacterium]|nr:ABC transporter ATP-binding protein [Verrucomicrobiae bacterium]